MLTRQDLPCVLWERYDPYLRILSIQLSEEFSFESCFGKLVVVQLIELQLQKSAWRLSDSYTLYVKR